MRTTWDEWFPAGSMKRKPQPATMVRLGLQLESVGSSGGWRSSFRTPKDQRAAYYFVQNPVNSMASTLKPHIDFVARTIQSSTGTFLAIQDSSSADFTTHPKTSGMGPLENSHCRGFFFHPSLVVDPSAVPVGLLALQTWVNPETPKAPPDQRDFDEKQSRRWWDATVAAEKALAQPGRLLHVSDRESFIFEYLKRCQGASYRALVRARGSHGVIGPKGQLLGDLVPGWTTAEAPRVLALPSRSPQKGRPARLARQATLRVRYGKFELQEPGRGAGRVTCWGISVKEEGYDGEDAIEWLLVTTDPVETDEQANQMIDWYVTRWTIEELNKGLKTGTKIEGLQLESREAIERALPLLLLTAVRLLTCMKMARATPEAAPPASLSTEVVEYLKVEAQAEMAARRPDRRKPVPDQPSVSWVVLRIGIKGGHSGRASEGPVGWELFWRGWRRLQSELAGFRQALKLAGPSLDNDL